MLRVGMGHHQSNLVEKPTQKCFDFRFRSFDDLPAYVADAWTLRRNCDRFAARLQSLNITRAVVRRTKPFRGLSLSC
jgi:hypothetical protein